MAAASRQCKRGIGLVVRGVAEINRPIPCSRAASVSARNGVHSSAYDKNPEDHVRPALVPDDVIQAHSTTSWGPHPATGIFGPSDRHVTPEPSLTNAGTGSVLEQKAWFRPHEDVEKPPPLA